MPNQWKSISEAPKDGTWFLAYCVAGKETFVGQIRASGDGATGDFMRWEGPYSDGFDCDVLDSVGEPTHFMFLPDPPNTD